MQRLVSASLVLVAAGCGSTAPGEGETAAPTARPVAYELAQQAAKAPAPAAPAESKSSSRVLGYVEGEVVTLREVLQRAGPVLAQIEDPLEKERRQERAFLDLVGDRLLYRAAVDAGVTALRDEIDEKRDQLVRDLAKNGGTLDAYLHERDMTRREHDEMLKVGIVVEKYVYAAIGHGRDANVHVRPVTDTYVPPEDVAKYYERHPEKFKLPALAKCRLLKIATDLDAKDRERAVADARAKANGVLARLRGGEDWVPVYRSVAPAAGDPQRTDGLSEFPRGKMAPWIEEFAFKSGKNALSDVIQNGTDFWILRAEGAHEERVMSFAEAEPGITRLLSNARFQTAFIEVELSVLDQSSVQPDSLRARLREYLREARSRVFADNGL
jgi:hypothetical protein